MLSCQRCYEVLSDLEVHALIWDKLHRHLRDFSKDHPVYLSSHGRAHKFCTQGRSQEMHRIGWSGLQIQRNNGCHHLLDQFCGHMHLEESANGRLQELKPLAHVQGLVNTRDNAMHLCQDGGMVQAKAWCLLRTLISAEGIYVLEDKDPEKIEVIL